MVTLTEFMLARLEERIAVIRRVTDLGRDQPYVSVAGASLVEEYEVQKRIVAEITPSDNLSFGERTAVRRERQRAMRLLAWPYRYHEDWQREWDPQELAWW